MRMMWVWWFAVSAARADDVPPGGGAGPVEAEGGGLALRGSVSLVGPGALVSITQPEVDHDRVILRYNVWVDGVMTSWSEEIEASTTSELRVVIHPLALPGATRGTLAVRMHSYREGRSIATAAASAQVVELLPGGAFTLVPRELQEVMVDGVLETVEIAGLGTDALPRAVPEEVTDVE